MKTSSFFLQLSFLFFLLILMSACAPQTAQQNNVELIQLHERDTKDLQDTYQAYHKLEGIDVSVFLKKQDLNILINNSFKAFLEEFSAQNSKLFAELDFKPLHLEISQQSLRSRFRFSFEVNDNKQKVFGDVKAHHHISVGKNEFKVDTKVNKVVLDKFDAKVESSEQESSQNITKLLKHFTHRLNIAFSNRPLNIKVDMNVLSQINEHNIYKAEDYSTHWIQPIDMKTKMKIFVPYFSNEGLLLLGSSQESSQEVRLENDFDKIPLILKNLIDSELNREMGTSLSQIKKYSSYYISKKYMAEQLSRALKDIDMRVINKFFMEIKPEDQNISKNIYFFDKNNLPSCKGVRVNCKEKLSECDKRCPMKYGIQNCSTCEEISNPFEKVRCLSKVEGCRSSQEKLLYNCHKQENNCVTQNVEDEKQCEIQNIQKTSLCQEKKKELIFINDEIVISRLNLNFTTPSSYAVQRLRRMEFSEDLNSIKITRDIHLSMESKTAVTMQYSSHKDLSCGFLMQSPLQEHSEYDYVNQKRTLPLLSENLSDGRLMLRAMSKPSFRSVKLKNPAYEQLLKNSNFSLNCSYQQMPMKAISGEDLLKQKEIPYALNPMLSEIELPFEQENLSFIISPVKLGKDILLFPRLERKAIGFSRQAHFY